MKFKSAIIRINDVSLISCMTKFLQRIPIALNASMNGITLL